MKVAVIGSRTERMTELQKYLPGQTTEIGSGGAKGVDTDAKNYAQTHGIRMTEFLPDYRRYGKAAPLLRNLQIIAYADMVIAVWDGKSKGTKSVIDACEKRGIPLLVVRKDTDKQ